MLRICSREYWPASSGWSSLMCSSTLVTSSSSDAPLTSTPQGQCTTFIADLRGVVPAMVPRLRAATRGNFLRMIGVRERLHDRERLRGLARGFWRARLERVRVYAWPIVQGAMAAPISWQVAHALLPPSQPVFAAVMAVNALGISVGQRGRLAFETVLGVATGIGVASLALDAVGSGAVQLGVLTALAMSLALLIGGGTTYVAG